MRILPSKETTIGDLLTLRTFLGTGLFMKNIVFLFLVVSVSMRLPIFAEGSTDPSQFVSRPQRFLNQVVMITGASRGIGKAIAKQFAKEGAKLVLIGRDEVTLKNALRELEAEAIYIQGDVSFSKDVERMIQGTLTQYGKVDILCHNAGIYPHSRLENMTLDEWREVIDVNLTGTFLVVKACIPWMKSQGSGKIVITSSISGPQTALPGFSHYTASKGGIAGFIRTAAVELAKYKININAVEPGNIMTESLSKLGPDHLDQMIRAIPLNRLGTPEEVAYATLFLASQEASYITGQSIIVDGGQTLPESHFSEY